ncbi:hypothetical protein ACEPAH_5335 [Sanghuangporus vaninii]
MHCDNRMIRIPRNGIYKLPDELLLIIVQYGVSSYGDMIRLASVCPRFKTIVCSPTVWSKCLLTVDSGTDIIEAIIRGSRGAFLSASIVLRIQDMFFERRGPEYPSNAYHVLRHSSLFKDVHINLYDLFSISWKNVFIEHPMPRLLRLETSFIPRPMPLNMVTQCILKLIYGFETQSELLDFLSSVPALRSLKITVMEMQAEEVETRSNKTVALRNLREMELGVGEGRCWPSGQLSPRHPLEPLYINFPRRSICT